VLRPRADQNGESRLLVAQGKRNETKQRNARLRRNLYQEKAGEARRTSQSTPQPEKMTMEPLTTALRLLHRQSELEEAMRRPGGIRVVEEREVYALREQLKNFPAAVRAILDAVNRLHRPVETLSPRDVEAGQ
jgi:hypothetical protein